MSSSEDEIVYPDEDLGIESEIFHEVVKNSSSSFTIKYKNKNGENITPVPLYIPPKPSSKSDPLKKSLKSLFSITNAMYALSGLGALSKGKSKTLEEDDKEETEDGKNDIEKIEDEEAKINMKSLQEKSSLKGSISMEEEDNISSSCDVLLTETDTFWTLNLAGTCVDETMNEESIQIKNFEEDERYEKLERWSQTLDYPKKKKGTQTTQILLKETTTQTNPAEMKG